MNALKRLLAEEDANGVVEYGLLLALLSVLLFASFTSMRESFVSLIIHVIGCLDNAVSGRGC